METKRLKSLSPFLNGLKVEIIRKSKKTGGYTVKLVERSTANAYPIGTKMNVSGYNLEDTDGPNRKE